MYFAGKSISLPAGAIYSKIDHLLLKRFRIMSIDISKHVDVSSERKSFFWNHMQNLQKFSIPQLSNWSGTFLDTRYSKAALVEC